TQVLSAKDRAELLLKIIGPKATPSTEIMPGQGAQLPPGTSVQIQYSNEGDDTSHLSTLDAAGNAVSLTTTVNYGFGAGIVAKGTGIVWNNEMDDFAVAPGVENAYQIVG